MVVKGEGDDGKMKLVPYLCEMTEQGASLCGTNPMARFNALVKSLDFPAHVLPVLLVDFSWG